MRTLPAVLAISAAVHAVGLAWVSTYTKDKPDLVVVGPATTVEIIEAPAPLPPVADVPVDVAVLDESTSVAKVGRDGMPTPTPDQPN